MSAARSWWGWPVADLAAAFAQVAGLVSGVAGGPYYPARIVSAAEPTFDDGGSLIPAPVPAYRACQAQVDAATESMRQSEGFTEKDQRILVLAAGLTGDITTDDQIEVAAGPSAGTWLIQSVARDPLAIYFDLRARPA